MGAALAAGSGGERPEPSSSTSATPIERAQPSTSATRVERAQPTTRSDTVGRRGFLYQVTRSKAASAGKLFLYGTVHVGKVGLEPFNPVVLRALGESRRIALEADPTDRAGIERLVALLGRYPAGDGLDRHVPPALLDRVRSFGKRSGLPPDRIGQFRPWLLATTVSLASLGSVGLDPTLGSEVSLSGYAHGARLPVVEIEGIEAQLRMLASLPEALQTAQLDEALADADSSEARAEGLALYDLWLHGDAAAGEQIVAELHREAQSRVYERYFVDTLLDGRNRTMADQAEQWMRDAGTTFFAVGTLHLFGEAGLIHELERRGYDVIDLQNGAAGLH